MTDPKNISILDYTYDLPEEKIALHPLHQRDQSKLLVWKDQLIGEDQFENITTYLPENSLLVFNNSKVINARIRFKKTTGSTIEIFCLEPYGPLNDYALVMNQSNNSRWKCFIGGLSKWKEPFITKTISHQQEEIVLTATLQEKIQDAYVVSFEWTPSTLSFAEILMKAGDIPLPPYIKRDADSDDAGRYQTIYAKTEGSVAAPTAGLHFSENIFNKFSAKNILKTEVSLHVGAGTFKPVKANTMEEHEMHAEWIDVDTNTLNALKLHDKTTVAVGTTSLRTIESLYWMGVKAYLNPAIQDVSIKQWDVYERELNDVNLNKTDAIQALINWMDKHEKERIFTQTQLLITPGYGFRIAQALITNFHQPQSTLLLLVAAAMGDDWKKCYSYALQNDFRFLSYGDGSLLFINP